MTDPSRAGARNIPARRTSECRQRDRNVPLHSASCRVGSRPWGLWGHAVAFTRTFPGDAILGAIGSHDDTPSER